MLNMIFRLANKEELRVGFPKKEERTNYICKHVPFKPSCIDELNYNVIVNHHVWSPGKSFLKKYSIILYISLLAFFKQQQWTKCGA